jgi:3-hydroxyanthranilate 3,4-dioxygenase
MSVNPVYNIKKWIDENKDMLKPPVGNKLVYEDTEIIVMMVGGPNARKDYHHHQRGPEFFIQIEGDIVLKVMEESGPKNILIREGDMYLMPGNTIHSPQRPPNTIGLVIELKAKDSQIDNMYWYCENCNSMLHKETFNLQNIVTELPPIMSKFFSSSELRTCKKCGTMMEKPSPLTSINDI